MFILRRITSEGREGNQVLGEGYNTVFDHQREPENQKEFQELLDPWPAKEEIFGFVVHNKGSNIIPLYKKSTYYVMCSDGKTFDRISFKQ